MSTISLFHRICASATRQENPSTYLQSLPQHIDIGIFGYFIVFEKLSFERERQFQAFN